MLNPDLLLLATIPLRRLSLRLGLMCSMTLCLVKRVGYLVNGRSVLIAICVLCVNVCLHLWCGVKPGANSIRLFGRFGIVVLVVLTLV